MMNDYLDKIVLLVPSYVPDDKMPQYVKELIKAGVKHVVIVDDGSSIDTQKYFDEIKNLKEVVLLVHDVNKGKGRALKTGFSYIKENMVFAKGVITADADGQHAVDDTIACAKRLYETNNVVFGTRNFNEDIVPFKSRNGNKITTIVFKLLYGVWVNDTQTGLRGIPFNYLDTCLSLEGERYDYEIAMLIKMVLDKMPIEEVTIKTIYFDSNRGSHFNAFKDSFKIYKIMFKTFFKFIESGLLSSLIDIALYSILAGLVFNGLNYQKAVAYSTILARIVSSIFNYCINKNKVFGSNEKTLSCLLKYYLLAFIQMLCSSFLVSSIYGVLKINSSIIKIVVDLFLFFISYQVQRILVFKEGK